MDLDATRSTAPPVDLRPVSDDDAAALTALVASCYAEYQGCVLDPDGEDADLAAPATAFAAKGGELWVLPDAEGVVASAGWAPGAVAGTAEVKRVYVAARGRRQGLATRLVRLAEQAAVAGTGAERIVAWSDTRFLDAHRLYERLGYDRTGRTRDLHDPSDTTEFEFVRVLAP